MKKFFTRLLIDLFIVLTMIGFVIPFLISAKSTIAAVAGIVLMIATIFYGANRLLIIGTFLGEKINELSERK